MSTIVSAIVNHFSFLKGRKYTTYSLMSIPFIVHLENEDNFCSFFWNYRNKDLKYKRKVSNCVFLNIWYSIFDAMKNVRYWASDDSQVQNSLKVYKSNELIQQTFFKN